MSIQSGLRLCVLGFAIPCVFIVIGETFECLTGRVLALRRETVGCIFLLGILLGAIGLSSLDQPFWIKMALFILCVAMMFLSLLVMAFLIARFFGFEAT